MSDRIVSMKSFNKNFGRNSYYSMSPVEYYQRRKAGWRRENARDYALINDTLYEIKNDDISVGGYYVQGLPVYFEEYRDWSIPVGMIKNIISIRPFEDCGDDYPCGAYRTDDFDVYIHYSNGAWYFIDLFGIELPKKVKFRSIHKSLCNLGNSTFEVEQIIDRVATKVD